jgi:hypothetical protein
MYLISMRVFKIPGIPGILVAPHTRFVGVGKVMFNLRPARPPARPPTKSTYWPAALTRLIAVARSGDKDKGPKLV